MALDETKIPREAPQEDRNWGSQGRPRRSPARGERHPSAAPKAIGAGKVIAGGVEDVL
jgi:hypothetical protein